jgi:hypothetical protein
MTLDRTRPDAHEDNGVLDGSTSGDEGCEHVLLALRRLRREGAAQVHVPHASRLAAASDSSRP